jgi:hypothetical protein
MQNSVQNCCRMCGLVSLLLLLLTHPIHAADAADHAADPLVYPLADPASVVTVFAKEIAVFGSETPHLRALLEQAFSAEIGHGQVRSPLRAAIGYCDAAREGSVEGHYRLARLYLQGNGVEKSLPIAATLLHRAAQQGHSRAQALLALTGVRVTVLPICLTDPESAWASYADPGYVDIERYAEQLPADRHSVVALIRALAPEFGIDPRLALSIAAVESNFNTQARSPKNAMGVMQLIPDTATRFNVNNAFNAEQNIRGGLAYLKWLMAFFGGDLTRVVAAYNAGEGAVQRYDGIPPYAETQAYVRRVMQFVARPPRILREERRPPVRGGLPH